MQTSSKADAVETADRFFVMVNGQVESAEVWEFCVELFVFKVRIK
jgi:hypothetical protein